jgi:hypothetical protein
MRSSQLFNQKIETTRQRKKIPFCAAIMYVWSWNWFNKSYSKPQSSHPISPTSLNLVLWYFRSNSYVPWGSMQILFVRWNFPIGSLIHPQIHLLHLKSHILNIRFPYGLLCESPSGVSHPHTGSYIFSLGSHLHIWVFTAKTITRNLSTIPSNWPNLCKLTNDLREIHPNREGI